ncbi:MAG: sigma-54-dependent Fis family transcriptional regulator [bacterium]|nr:MAG: sigma-54-dependent Fis family transcriptional regulator [bacterium]
MTGARILIVDDEKAIRDGLHKILEAEGYQAELSHNGYSAVEKLQDTEFELVITDLKMPGMDGMEVLNAISILQPNVPVIFITGYSTVEKAVEVMKIGAFDYLPKPFTPRHLLEKVGKALEHRAFLLEGQSPIRHLSEQIEGINIIGQSAAMKKVFMRIDQVAPTDSTVLITGESGTGKELVARAIHQLSPRRSKPFIAIDCTTLVENLLESELFGHVKGSFTGAIQTKTGLFKVADGGTLFLDEVSNITPPIQAKLLRVLQERVITPIGSTETIPIDIRLIAATNRDLKELVEDGAFREDLVYRLNIVPIHLPPLCERNGDLNLLVTHFLKKHAEEIGKDIQGMAPGAMAVLKNYPFPGNVRELENIIERAVVLAKNRLILVEDLEIKALPRTEPEPPADRIPESADELKWMKKKLREDAVKPLEQAFLLAALERNDWNVTRAAQEVGMLRPNFQSLLKKQGISVKERGLKG